MLTQNRAVFVSLKGESSVTRRKFYLYIASVKIIKKIVFGELFPINFGLSLKLIFNVSKGGGC